MNACEALGAGVARVTLGRASGELAWVPEATLEQLATLAEHWAEHNVRWSAYEAQWDVLGQTQCHQQLNDMGMELRALLGTVAEAHMAQMGYHRDEGTLTLSSGHAIRVDPHPATSWLLDVFGAAAGRWVWDHALIAGVAVRP